MRRSGSSGNVGGCRGPRGPLAKPHAADAPGPGFCSSWRAGAQVSLWASPAPEGVRPRGCPQVVMGGPATRGSPGGGPGVFPTARPRGLPGDVTRDAGAPGREPEGRRRERWGPSSPASLSPAGPQESPRRVLRPWAWPPRKPATPPAPQNDDGAHAGRACSGGSGRPCSTAPAAEVAGASPGRPHPRPRAAGVTLPVPGNRPRGAGPPRLSLASFTFGKLLLLLSAFPAPLCTAFSAPSPGGRPGNREWPPGVVTSRPRVPARLSGGPTLCPCRRTRGPRGSGGWDGAAGPGPEPLPRPLGVSNAAWRGGTRRLRSPHVGDGQAWGLCPGREEALPASRELRSGGQRGRKDA